MIAIGVLGFQAREPRVFAAQPAVSVRFLESLDDVVDANVSALLVDGDAEPSPLPLLKKWRMRTACKIPVVVITNNGPPEVTSRLAALAGAFWVPGEPDHELLGIIEGHARSYAERERELRRR